MLMLTYSREYPLNIDIIEYKSNILAYIILLFKSYINLENIPLKGIIVLGKI